MRLLLLLFLIPFLSVAQVHTPVEQEVTPNGILAKYAPAGKVYPSNIKEDWSAYVQNLELPSPGGIGYRDHLAKLKEGIPPVNTNPPQKKTSAFWVPKPTVLSGFEGNDFNGSIPNDNDVAISNSGKLVSVKNTNINFYDIPADSLLGSISLQAFADTLGLPYSKYDPKVRYDPVADKFIMVYLSGFNDSTSNIVVAFSSSSDPMDPWNIYSLSGDPKGTGTWSDYPIIALTNDELFITVNALYNDSTWQAGFYETLVWQIDKADGYAGGTLTSLTHNNVTFGGKPIRNLCLVQGGSGLAGPEMYLLSNRNFDMENDTIFICKVTGNIASSPTIDVGFAVSDLKYGLAPDARQFGKHYFATNDSRILGAYIENDQIHFVGNSIDHTLNTCGVYHGVIDDVSTTPTVHGHIISDVNLDFGYPNISYTGNGTDDQGIISYNHTGTDTAAGVSASYFFGTDHSERRSIHTGTTYVNIQGGFGERWGDYTGTQRKYDDPDVVWIAGYSSKITGVAPFTQKENAVWIAELKAEKDMITSTEKVETRSKAPKVFPNPAYDFVFVEFEMQDADVVSFELFDMQGRLVKRLLLNRVKKGTNLFTFNAGMLEAGSYILRLTSVNGGEVFTETIVRN